MENIDFQMHRFNGTDNDNLYPATKSYIVEFNTTGTNISGTNIESAFKENLQSVQNVSLTSSWINGSTANTFIQNITSKLSNINTYSKIDIQMSASEMSKIANTNITSMYIYNDAGNIYVCSVGDKPSVALNIQASVLQVGK